MGLGLRIPLAALSNATLHAALVELLDSPGYRTAGARLARIVKATGGYREGADWVEYVFVSWPTRGCTRTCMHAAHACAHAAALHSRRKLTSITHTRTHTRTQARTLHSDGIQLKAHAAPMRPY